VKKLILFFAIFLFAQDIKFDTYISKVTFNKKYLITGLENGQIIIKDFNSLKLIKKIKLPQIEDFMGDKIAMPIYSIDILNDRILILGQGNDAERKVFIYNIKNGNLKDILTSSQTYMNAHFIDKDRILFALLSDELSLYDLKNRKTIYTKQVGQYVFSTIALNSSRDMAIIGDESGSLKLLKTATGEKLKQFNKFNKDQTISVAFNNNLVMNGSSDKRVSLIDIENGRYLLQIQVKFLPYGTAISPNGKFVAVQYNEKNDIAIFNINGKLIEIIKGQTMPLNGMKFINNRKLLSFSADKIMINKIKE